MRVIVLGAGVIGVTTAYYLARMGCEVAVVERQPGPGLETSYANAGEISPGYASPWAAPDVPRKVAGWLLMKHSPLILRPRFDPAMMPWLWALLQNCRADRYAVNKERMVRLAQYSRHQLATLRSDLGISYDERMRGTLQVFRKQAQLDGAAKDIAVLASAGIAYEVLDARGCIAAEPGLAHSQSSIAGGLRLPGDETGDCYKFTTALAERCAALGVRFHYGTAVKRLLADRGQVSAVSTEHGEIEGDAYVVALGSHSPKSVRPLGLSLPVYPVKGYSITAPITDPSRAPRSTLLDESYKIAITRLGDRVRVGGMAEICGYDLSKTERRRATLLHSLSSLFPDCANLSDTAFWTGLRPMTPDGTPVVGPTTIANLWLNTGHGTLGWTMACGSARLLADQMAGYAPEIASEDLGIMRYADT